MHSTNLLWCLAVVLIRVQDTTAEIRVHGAFVLLLGFVALAASVGHETILGAFAAGALLSVVDRDEMLTHLDFRTKLEAAGFGIFIPRALRHDGTEPRHERAR